MSDYNMLPADVVIRDNVFRATGYGVDIAGLHPSRPAISWPPIEDCGGCGARDYRAGRCSYCGRQG